MPINLGNIKKLEEEKKKLLQEQNNLNVGSNTSTQNAILTNNNSNRTWLKSGAFSDGYQAGDITKTVLGTAGDIGSNLLKGVVRAGEGIGDLLAYGGAQIVDWLGNEEYANQVRQNASEDLTGKIFSGLDNVIEPNSVLGEKSQSVVSSIGQMYASAVTSSKVLGTKGNIGLNIGGKKFNIPTTSIISGASSGMGEAYQKGAEDWQAWLTGAGGGLAEGLSESLFGTFGLGGSALDDALVKSVTQNMRSGLAKSMTKAGIKAAGEGVEEVVSYLLDYGSKQAIDYGKKTFNLSGPDLAEKFNSEELWENFFSGALAAAIGGLPSTISEAKGNTPQFNVNEGYRQNRTSLPIIKNNTTNNLNSMRYSLNENGINAPIANNDGTIVNPNRFQYVKSDNVKIDNLRKSASKYFNNSQETQNFVNTIENIISDKDYNVTFDNTLKSKNGNSVNAQITTNKNGEVEIKINPNSNRAGEFLLVHEITHAIETDNMKKLVLDYASKNSEFNTALESLKQTYGTNDVNSEVLADISGQLFGNQEFINSLSMEQPNIFRRIYNKIIELANKITGNSHEALFIQDLKNKWEEAYRTQNNNLRGKNYSIVGLVGLNNMQESNFKKNGLSNYQQALEMQKQGIDNETIRQQTKWFQDKNGNWKFEVDDNSLTINNNILQKNKTYKLGDIISHNILFKLYPELANYEVSFKSKKNNGSYNNKNQTFEISNAFLDSANYKNLKGTLIHEIQHAIQHIEGFEAGTTSKLSKKAYYESLGEIEADNQKNRYMKNYTKEDRMRIAPESSKENPVHSQYESYISNRNLIDKTKDAIYPFIKKGLSNDKINQEILGKSAKSNNTLVDGRRLLENSSSFSFDSNIQRYDDLSKTNYIEYFRKDNGDVRVNLIDSNNNLINQLDLWSNTEAIKQFGEKLGNQLYNYATDNNQKINIGNDINNLGLETDYFMSHRPTQTGLTADNLINQNVETPMPKDIYNHPEYYFQMSEKSSQESMSVLRKVRGNPNAEVTIYRATPGNKINKGDWITLSKSYAEWHNQSQFDGKANVLEMKVKAKDVQYAGDDINEFGYFPDGDIKNSISNKTWQEYLEENYLSSGTRTNMQNIKIPTAQDIKRVENNNIDLPNHDRVLNPLEISQLNPEDASTTPPLPNVRRNRVNDGNSSFASNIQNKTNMLNEEQKGTILSDEEVRYYDKITNKESLEKAFEKLNNNGRHETESWFAKDSENATATDVAEGWILLKQYADNNDSDGMVAVAKKLRDMGTKAGQTVQAFNIMARMTPEGMVKYAQSELSEAYDRMVKGKTKKWIEQHQKDFDLTPQETGAIMDIMKKVSTMEDGYDKRVELAKIQKIMTDKLPPAKGAGIKSWMRISMLFNPKTQVRNVMGNAVIAPVNAFGDLFASMADKVIGSKTGYRTTGVTNIQNYVKGFKEGLYQSYNDFKQGINTRNIEGNRFEISEGKSFNDNTVIGKSLNKVDSLLSFMLDAGDRAFYEATFVNSINNQLVLNNTTNVTQEMIDIATQEALSRTWQDNNNYTRFVLSVRKMMNNIHVGGYGLGDVLIPFAKTPANLTKAIVDYSPVGVVTTLIKGKNLKNAIETGQFTPQMQHDFVQSLGKATVGTMLYVAGYALAKAGVVSGESDDDKDVRDFIKNTLGVNSYSIKIGDKSFTYDWAQPIAAPLSIMANIVQKDKEDVSTLEKVISSLDTAGNILLEQSFMESINTALSNNDGLATGIEEAILDLPARAVPTLMKQIVDLTDSTQRQSFEYDKPIQSMINSVKAKIPGLSQTLAPSVDTMGREIQRYGGKNNIFNVFLNPANVSTENISESAGEIYRLYKETGNTNIMPRVAPYYINKDGEKITLNSSQRAQYQKASGNIIEKEIEKLLNNSQYNKMSDEKKSEVISDIVNYSYNIAQKEVLGTELSDTYQKVYEYGKIGDVSDYYAFRNSVDDTDKNTKKESITSYLLNSTLSDKELASLYGSYYSSEETLEDMMTLKIPIKEYIKLDSQEFTTDYDSNGKAITNSKKNKIINYVNSLNLSIPQKAILIKSQYSSYDAYNKQIVSYVNSQNLSKFDKATLLKSIGFDDYNSYIVEEVNSRNISAKEKEEILDDLGFRIVNGRVYW